MADIGNYMRQYAEEMNIMNKPQKKSESFFSAHASMWLNTVSQWAPTTARIISSFWWFLKNFASNPTILTTRYLKIIIFFCDGSLEEKECLAALKEMSHNKTPGCDGIPAEFFTVFWSDIKHYMLLHSVFLLTVVKCLDQKRGIINWIPKPGKNHCDLKNWRPTSSKCWLQNLCQSSSEQT